MTKRDWKAITIDWDALEFVDDDDQCTVCISTREIMILKALLITAYWTTRWENLGETEKILRQRMARLDGRLDICSNAGGDSYITTVNINALFIQLFISLWDGDPTDINPEAPTTTWNTGDTDNRNAALCMASMALVDTICAMEMQALSNRYTGAMLIFAVLLFLIPGAAVFGVLIVGALLADLTYDAAMAALGDRQARLDVACCMLAGLQNEAVTSEVLSESLDSCGFTPGTNEAIVRDYVYESIQSTETYYAMINAAGNAFIQVDVLGINLCECGDCGIVTFDAPLSDLPYTIQYGEVDGLGNPAQCIWGVFYNEPPTYPYGEQVELTVELPAEATITKVTFDRYAASDLHPSGGNIGREFTYYDSSMVEQDSYEDEVFANPDWETDELVKTVGSVKYVRIREWYSCNCPTGRIMRIDNIRLFCS